MDKIQERINREINQVRQDAHDLSHLRTLEKSIVERMLVSMESIARARNGDKQEVKDEESSI